MDSYAAFNDKVLAINTGLIFAAFNVNLASCYSYQYDLEKLMS